MFAAFNLFLALIGLAISIIGGFGYGPRLEAYLDRKRLKLQERVSPYFEADDERSARVKPTWRTKFEVAESFQVWLAIVAMFLVWAVFYAAYLWLDGEPKWYMALFLPILIGGGVAWIFIWVGLFEIAVLPLWYIMHLLNMFPAGIVTGIGILLSVIGVVLAVTPLF